MKGKKFDETQQTCTALIRCSTQDVGVGVGGLVALGEETPVGPLGPVADVGDVAVGTHRRHMPLPANPCQCWLRSRERCLYSVMAGGTVTVHFRDFSIFRNITAIFFVLMTVVAKVRHFFCLVLAVCRSRRPRVLERQHNQEQDEQQFFHGPIIAVGHATGIFQLAV